MRSKNTFITNDTFIRFVYKFFKNFNFDNKEYLQQVKNEYFKSAEFTLVENPTMDDPIGNDLLKSSGFMKQEVNKEQC